MIILSADLKAEVEKVAQNKGDFARLKQDLRWGFAHFSHGQPHSDRFERYVLPHLAGLPGPEMFGKYREIQDAITAHRKEYIVLNRVSSREARKQYLRDYARHRRSRDLDATWTPEVLSLADKLVAMVKAQGDVVSVRAARLIARALVQRKQQRVGNSTPQS